MLRPESENMSCGYVLPPVMCIHWSSLAQKMPSLTQQHRPCHCLGGTSLVCGGWGYIGPLRTDSRWQSGNGTGFSPCPSVSPARTFPSALQTHILFICHLCYTILPTDTMSATGAEHCMPSDITNMIGIFRKKPCNVGAATVLTQVSPSNGKELKTEAFKDPYSALFPHSCAQNLPLHSAVYFRNTIAMT